MGRAQVDEGEGTGAGTIVAEGGLVEQLAEGEEAAEGASLGGEEGGEDHGVWLPVHLSL